MSTRKASKRATRKAKAPDIVVKKGKKSSIPKVIYANASPRSVGGVSMFEAGDRITAETAGNFVSEDEVISRSINRLQDAGFQVLNVSRWALPKYIIYMLPSYFLVAGVSLKALTIWLANFARS